MNDIDYVVPMVFHEDSLWRETFRRVGGVYDESNLYDFVRYRSWGTEELLIRCVRKFMPWVRKIYILLAQESQVQNWMIDNNLTIVFHREFMPQKYTPTFNSREIEMFLKDINGISDCFLYGNDDMFPISPLKEEDFFVDGKPCIKMKVKAYPTNPNNFQKACMGGLNFVAEEFGKKFTNTWLKNGHSIAPILKSTCEHLWQRGESKIVKSLSPFRKDNNYNQYIYSWWQYLSGEYVDKSPNRTYVSTKSSISDVVRAIEKSEGIVCVNDNECVTDYKAYGKAVIKAIEKKLNN